MIGLNDLTVTAFAAECAFDRPLICRKDVRRNLRRIDDPLVKVPKECLGVILGPLADAEADDRLQRFRHGEEEVLIALFSAVCRRPFSLLLADERPRFVKLHTWDLKAVLMRGNRLEITADVDADGLEKLQAMLEKYAEILKMMN